MGNVGRSFHQTWCQRVGGRFQRFHHVSLTILNFHPRRPHHDRVCNFTWTSPVSADHRTECSRDPRTLARTGAPLSPQERPKTECAHRPTLVILGLVFRCLDHNQWLVIDVDFTEEEQRCWWMNSCETNLCRPGLPGQPTQRLCVTDVIGLLQQRPADHLSLNGHKLDQHLTDWLSAHKNKMLCS